MLRDYQIKSIDLIRADFKKGHRKVLLWMATGLGKTTIFCEMVKQASNNGKRSMILTRGRKIVDQAAQRLAREHVPHGVYMASHWNFRPHLLTQVASVDTLISRQKFPEADLIIIDEAHQSGSDGYKQVISKYPEAFIVSVTATPYLDDGLRHCADSIVHPITMVEGIEQGYLVKPRYFAPSEPDMKGVRTKNGEFEETATMERMATLTGDIASHWKKFGQGRPSLCFAVNIAHSKQIVSMFEREGVRADHVDADSSDKERQEKIAKLEAGELDILSNVGILTTGVDIPCVGAIIMARPTQSYNLYLQICGRGTRPFPGKNDFIILDHAGNVKRHGFITEERKVSLDGIVKNEPNIRPKVCLKCYGVYVGSVCDQCGFELAPRERSNNLDVAAGELKEVAPSGNAVLDFIACQNTIARQRGYSKGWVFHKVKEQFGEEIAAQMYPGKARAEKARRRW